MKQMKQLLSAILVLAMVFQLMSLPTWAVTSEDNPSGNINTMNAEEATAAEISDKEAYVLYEVDDLREESEKHFRMSDGTYIAVSYGEAVHYQDADGNWQEIDNTLLQATGDRAMARNGVSAEPVVFESRNGNELRQFAAEFQSDSPLFAMSNGKFSLSMSVVLPEAEKSAFPADMDDTNTDTEAAATTDVTAATEMQEPVDASEAIEETVASDPAAEEATEPAPTEEPDESDTVSEDPTEPTLTEEPAESDTASEDPTEPTSTEEPAESDTASEDPTEPALTEEPVEADTASEEATEPAPTEVPVENTPVASEMPVDVIEKTPIMAAVENPVQAERATAQENLSLEEQIAPKLLTSSVSYQNVWQDTILRYQPIGRNVKESILVAKPQSSYEYLFRLELTGLRPLQNGDGSISLLDENDNEVYYIPQPYMEDADGAFSSAVRYTLTEDGESYLLAVTADADWLNDESRVFPVMIDPSVNENNSGVTDHIITTYVNSGRPNATSYSNTGYIRCGYYNNTAYDSDCTGTCKGFIYVKDLPTLPDGCVVTAAALRLFKEKHGGSECYPELYTSTLSVSYGNIETYLNNLTWNNHMNGLVYGGATTAAERSALDYVKEPAVPGEIEYGYTQHWDITPAVQSWYSGSTAISRLLVMDTGTTLSSNARATYSGYKNAEPTHCPTLIVYYQNMVGVENIYGYHTQSIGRAGTGYVNNFTLGLTMQNTLATSPSEATPFSLSLVYNSSNGKTSCTSGSIHTKSYAMNIGQGWKASVQQSVVSKTVGSTTYLIYMDADGTEHYFQKSDGVYKDEDGLNLSITSSNGTYTMTDKEKNTWEFYNGYLTKYTDNNGNILFYAYDGASSVSTSTTTWKPSSSGSHKVTSVW